MQEPVWKPTRRSGVLGLQRAANVVANGLLLRIGGLQPKVGHLELSCCARICLISDMHSAAAGEGSSTMEWLGVSSLSGDTNSFNR
jgi:hypothetical protein